MSDTFFLNYWIVLAVGIRQPTKPPLIYCFRDDSNHTLPHVRSRRCREKNYARVERETDRLISEICNLNRVTKEHGVSGLRKLTIQVQGHIALLTANGIPLFGFAITLKSAMEAAVPVRHHHEYKDRRQLQKEMAAAVSKSETATGQLDNGRRSARRQSSHRGSAIPGFSVRQSSTVGGRRSSGRWNESIPGNGNGVRLRDSRSHKPRLTSTVAAAAAAANTGSKKFPIRPCLFCNMSICQYNSEGRSSGSETDAGNVSARRTPALASVLALEPRAQNASLNSTTLHAPARCRSSSQRHRHRRWSAFNQYSATFLWTICAYVVNAGMRIPIRIFLDPGVNLTVLSPALRKLICEPAVAINNLTMQRCGDVVAVDGIGIYNIRIRRKIHSRDPGSRIRVWS